MEEVSVRFKESSAPLCKSIFNVQPPKLYIDSYYLYSSLRIFRLRCFPICSLRLVAPILASWGVVGIVSKLSSNSESDIVSFLVHIQAPQPQSIYIWASEHNLWYIKRTSFVTREWDRLSEKAIVSTPVDIVLWKEATRQANIKILEHSPLIISSLHPPPPPLPPYIPHFPSTVRYAALP